MLGLGGVVVAPTTNTNTHAAAAAPNTGPAPALPVLRRERLSETSEADFDNGDDERVGEEGEREEGGAAKRARR
jgi:hypothetical protein